MAPSAAQWSGKSASVHQLGILPTGRSNPTPPKRRTAWARYIGPCGGGPQRSPVAHGVLLPELPQVFLLPLAQATRQLPPAAPLPHAGTAALYGTAVRGGCRNAAWRRAAGGCLALLKAGCIYSTQTAEMRSGTLPVFSMEEGLSHVLLSFHCIYFIEINVSFSLLSKCKLTLNSFAVSYLGSTS